MLISAKNIGLIFLFVIIFNILAMALIIAEIAEEPIIMVRLPKPVMIHDVSLGPDVFLQLLCLPLICWAWSVGCIGTYFLAKLAPCSLVEYLFLSKHEMSPVL